MVGRPGTPALGRTQKGHLCPLTGTLNGLEVGCGADVPGLDGAGTGGIRARPSQPWTSPLPPPEGSVCPERAAETLREGTPSASRRSGPPAKSTWAPPSLKAPALRVPGAPGEACLAPSPCGRGAWRSAPRPAAVGDPRRSQREALPGACGQRQSPGLAPQSCCPWGEGIRWKEIESCPLPPYRAGYPSRLGAQEKRLACVTADGQQGALPEGGRAVRFLVITSSPAG